MHPRATPHISTSRVSNGTFFRDFFYGMWPRYTENALCQGIMIELQWRTPYYSQSQPENCPKRCSVKNCNLKYESKYRLTYIQYSCTLRQWYLMLVNKEMKTFASERTEPVTLLWTLSSTDSNDVNLTGRLQINAFWNIMKSFNRYDNEMAIQR